MQQPFTLYQPRLSEDGKLAFNGESYAKAEQSLSMVDYGHLKQHLGFNHWQTLKDYLIGQNSTEEGLPYTLLLHIEDYQEPYLDEIEQCFVWLVRDQEQNELFLRLYWDEDNRQRIEKLQQFLAQKPKIKAILVNPIQQDQHLEFQPFSLLYQDKKTDHITSLCLDFELPKRFFSKLKNSFISRIAEFLKKKENLVQSRYTPPSVSLRLTQPILACLEIQACTGKKIFSGEQRRQLTKLQQDCEQIGFTVLAAGLKVMLEQKSPFETSLLKTVYLCYLLQQMDCSLPISINQCD